MRMQFFEVGRETIWQVSKKGIFLSHSNMSVKDIHHNWSKTINFQNCQSKQLDKQWEPNLTLKKSIDYTSSIEVYHFKVNSDVHQVFLPGGCFFPFVISSSSVITKASTY